MFNAMMIWVPIDAILRSQPIVPGDNVFVTTAVTENEEKPRRYDGGLPAGAKDATKDVDQWKVLCVSLQSGKILWEQTPFEGTPGIPKHRGNSYASETPVTDGERVIAWFGARGLVCYNLAGEMQWTKSLGPFQYQAGWTIPGSLTRSHLARSSN